MKGQKNMKKTHLLLSVCVALIRNLWGADRHFKRNSQKLFQNGKNLNMSPILILPFRLCTFLSFTVSMRRFEIPGLKIEAGGFESRFYPA